MHLRKQSLLFLAHFFGAAAAGASQLAPTISNPCLQKLDAAAENFHSTTAHVEFDTIQTDPIPDTDVMTGTLTTSARASSFQMAAHINGTTTGHAKDLHLSPAGRFRVSDTGKESDAKTYNQAGKLRAI